MPLRIDLQVEGPDRAVFVVQGLRDIGREILVAVQRLDDQRYLTPHGLWDSAPSWHPCTRVGGDSGEETVRLAAASSLVAGIRAAAGATLQAHLRRGERSDLGPLIVRDHGAAGESEIHSASVARLSPEPASATDPAVAPGSQTPSEPLVPPPDLAVMHPPSRDPAPTHASNGASDRSERPEPGQPAVPLHAAATLGSEASDLTWSSAPTRETTWHLESAIRSASVDPQAARPRAGIWRWLALSIVVLAVLAALGLGIRAVVWRSAPDRDPGQPAHSPAPPSKPATHAPEPPSPLSPKPPQRPEAFQSVQYPKPPDRTLAGVSGTSGKALYLELKGQNLSPQDLFDRGAQADQAGDCEAAIRLLIDAAKRAPGLAERLARRYDPEGFEPTPCFPQAKPDSAIVWYQNAAEQDVPAAQRRYGELLLGEAASGPIYQDAVDWLRKAASAGDEGATRRLEALGER